MHATTILCVRDEKSVIMMSDGQVTLGHCVMKKGASKLRKLCNDKFLVGFAGGTADAFTLVERLEMKLEKYSHLLKRACIELAKDWRTDKVLRKLEAMLIVADINETFIVSGQGDVIAPDDDVAAIGSGGMYALAAARAILNFKKEASIKKFSAKDIAKAAMHQASSICIYTNSNYTTMELTKEK